MLSVVHNCSQQCPVRNRELAVEGKPQNVRQCRGARIASNAHSNRNPQGDSTKRQDQGSERGVVVVVDRQGGKSGGELGRPSGMIKLSYTPPEVPGQIASKQRGPPRRVCPKRGTKTQSHKLMWIDEGDGVTEISCTRIEHANGRSGLLQAICRTLFNICTFNFLPISPFFSQPS
jgi:hypothetical protein